ncbi:MAG: glycosyltransferase family 2 protein [Thermoplasmata archaeon]
MKLTIAIPTYNRADQLANLLNSIKVSAEFANLENNNYEILILDDGSEIKYDNIINQFSNLPIQYHKFNHTGNYGSALNKAINELAKGEILLILHDDIILEKNTLLLTFEFFKTHAPNIALKGGNLNEKIVYNETPLSPDRWSNQFVACNLQFIKTKKLQFKTDIFCYADTMFGVDFGDAGGMLIINPMIAYEHHRDFINVEEMARALIKIYNDYPEYFIAFAPITFPGAYLLSYDKLIMNYKIAHYENAVTNTFPDLIPPPNELNQISNEYLQYLEKLEFQKIFNPKFDLRILFLESEQSISTLWRQRIPSFELLKYIKYVDYTAYLPEQKYDIFYIHRPGFGIIQNLNKIKRLGKIVMDFNYNPFDDSETPLDLRILHEGMRMADGFVASNEQIANLLKPFNKPTFVFPTSSTELIDKLKPKSILPVTNKQKVGILNLNNNPDLFNRAKLIFDPKKYEYYYIATEIPQKIDIPIQFLPIDINSLLHRLTLLKLDYLFADPNYDINELQIYSQLTGSKIVTSAMDMKKKDNNLIKPNINYEGLVNFLLAVKNN